MKKLKNRVMSIANYVMGGVFLFAAVVQYNDPDVVAWILFYGAASAACLLHALGRYRRWLTLLVLIAGLVWAATIVPEFFEGERFSLSTFSSVRMTDMSYETAREFGGLAITAGWMAISYFLPPISARR